VSEAHRIREMWRQEDSVGAVDQLPEVALPQRLDGSMVAGPEQIDPARDRTWGRHGRSSQNGGKHRVSFYGFAWQGGTAKRHELNRVPIGELPARFRHYICAGSRSRGERVGMTSPCARGP
jgi:hypothetical protein